MVDRRVAGEPLEYILGWAQFCGLRIRVEPGVFVPRRRSEFLVQQAVGLTRSGAVVVDLCCGSGAIGAALVESVPGIELYAADLDPVAVGCARRNLAGRGQASEGDLYEALPAKLAGRVDVLVCSAPYVPTDAIDFMPAEARLHEPVHALDGGPDGMAVQRRVIAEAARWLIPGGHLLLETSAQQAPVAVGLLANAGLSARVAHLDDLEATVVIGRKPGAQAASQAVR